MVQKITEDSQALEFRTKSNNIIETLRMMEDHHLISPSVKLGFWSDVWKARSIEDLQDITSRLAAVSEGRPVSQVTVK